MLNLDDLQPLDDDKPFEFQFDGETYTVRSPNDIDVRKLRDMLEAAQSDPATQLAWMLGEEQWTRLEAAKSTFSLRHLNAVTEGWLAHHGIDVGKSGGSPSNSKSVRVS